MVDARRLLDALVGALSKAGAPGGGPGGVVNQVLGAVTGSEAGRAAGATFSQATSGLQEAAARANAAAGDVGARVDRAAAQAVGATGAGDIVGQAKAAVAQNPALAQAALAGVAGLLLANRRTRGVAGSVAGLGGLALIGGLAYKAFQNHQAGKPLLDAAGAPAGGAPAVGQAPASQSTPGPGPTREDVASVLASFDVPETSGFHPVSATEDDALLYLRAMVAAASADGVIDAAERARLTEALGRAGIDAEATRWLERELAAPADVEELAAGVTDPRKAAQVYTAARVAIDPDSMQEREFLRLLAESLDLDQALKAQIDTTAALVVQ